VDGRRGEVDGVVVGAQVPEGLGDGRQALPGVDEGGRHLRGGVERVELALGGPGARQVDQVAVVVAVHPRQAVEVGQRDLEVPGERRSSSQAAAGEGAPRARASRRGSTSAAADAVPVHRGLAVDGPREGGDPVGHDDPPPQARDGHQDRVDPGTRMLWRSSIALAARRTFPRSCSRALSKRSGRTSRERTAWRIPLTKSGKW